MTSAIGPSKDGADAIVERFHAIDDKVRDMTSSVKSDPDSLTDKVIKWVLPSLAGYLAGKIFQSFWDNVQTRRNGGLESEEGQQQGAIASLAFAVLSAALTTLVSGVIDRGSQAFVDRRHQRR